jgi:UTP--glucose-1-phosphate uridylyltransferase
MTITKAVLPVAGMGTRFLPASKAVPKELFPILDTPLIEYAVREAIDAGATDFIFIISPEKQAILKHFQDDPKLVASLMEKGKDDLIDSVKNIIPGAIHVVTQTKALGLGHAISLAREYVGDNPFHVLLPDDLVQSDTACQKQLADAYNDVQSGIVAVEDVDISEVHKYGVLDSDDTTPDLVKVKGFVEKPSADVAPSALSIIGRYILPASIFDSLEKGIVGAGGEIQITDAMADVVSREDFYGLRFTGTRFDCGSKAGFLEAQIAFATQDDDLKNELSTILKKYL